MFKGKKYNLTANELKGISNLCSQEQGTIEGAKAEASLMVNKYEMLTNQSKYSGLYNYIRTCGWWAYAPKHMDNGNSSEAIVEGVKDVICNGNRTLPPYVDEHDCISPDIKSISTGNVHNKEDYIKDVTIIKNIYGSTYTFYCFPDEYSDPFGYTQKQETKSYTTSDYIQGVISKAEKEIGYLEKSSNNNLSSKTDNAGYSNYTKYWYDIYPEFQGEPWCACFVTWVFTKVFGLAVTKKMFKHYPFVYCPTLAYMTNNYEPKVGSVVLFYRDGEYVHTGIVVKVTEDTIQTIEGNTSGGSSIIDNGGGVCRKTYDRDSLSSKTKFFMPDYSLVEDFDNFDNVETLFDSSSILEYGDESNLVRELQESLNKLGYNLDVDGEFGKMTLKAVKDFQEVCGLDVDGEVGDMTKKAIKTALESGLPKPSKFSLLTNRVKVPIRKKSSSSSEIVARIPNKNYEVDQTGNTFKNRNGKLWYEVKYEDITGWIYETNLKVVTK